MEPPGSVVVPEMMVFASDLLTGGELIGSLIHEDVEEQGLRVHIKSLENNNARSPKASERACLLSWEIFFRQVCLVLLSTFRKLPPG
jgi:hypothetical protein